MMGNHAVGRAFVAVATAMNDRRKEGETALEILDAAADASEVRGMDAEFDDATMRGESFHDLIVEAFGPVAMPEMAHDADGDDADEAYVEAFYDGPYLAFRTRYDLC